MTVPHGGVLTNDGGYYRHRVLGTGSTLREAVAVVFLTAAVAVAQEAEPTPEPTEAPVVETPTPTAAPTPTATASATPTAAPTPEAKTAVSGPSTRVAYFYKVRWGFQDEFERLYVKNHYPILLAQMERGRIRDIQVYRPVFHGDGRADWTYLVILTWASWTDVGDPSQEEAISRRLFPDRETYRREEQRRFELIEAHWDVPLKNLPSGR